MDSVNSPRYLVVGSGRAAQHLQAYLYLEDQCVKGWSRDSDPLAQPLSELFQWSDVVLLLISDRAIESFYLEHIKPWLSQHHEHNLKAVHCSGSFSHPEILGFHPLMSFRPGEPYGIDTYREMAFVGDTPASLFREIFPSLDNPYFQISPQDRAYYHSLCVLGGNLSAWLWRQVMNNMTRHLDIPAEALWPYMDQLNKNLKAKPESALTGPIVRGDQNTIEANLKALKAREELTLLNLYQTFAEGVRHEH